MSRLRKLCCRPVAGAPGAVGADVVLLPVDGEPVVVDVDVVLPPMDGELAVVESSAPTWIEGVDFEGGGLAKAVSPPAGGNVEVASRDVDGLVGFRLTA